MGQAGPHNYYFLSQLLNCRVFHEGNEQAFGRLHDIGAHYTSAAYPLAVCLEVKRRYGNTVVIPWSDVIEFTPQKIIARKETGAAPQADFWLRRDVLDDQVVDISGAKVVRVNDVHVLHAEGQLIIAHVEVGMRGLLRRLGFEKAASRLLNWLLDYSLKDEFITWRNVQLISPGAAPVQIRISAAPTPFAEIHPAELADILEQLSVRERQTFFSKLPVETAAEALGEADPETQRSLISQEKPDKAADILEEMPAKDAADVLRDLDRRQAQGIMSRMDREAAEDVQSVLIHDQRSAGGAMGIYCFEASPSEGAAQVLVRIRTLSEEVDVFNYVYVLDEQRRLLGVVGLRELLKAEPGATMERLMGKDLVTVTPETSLKAVARLFAKYGFRAIPVIDDKNVFLGAVRLISILEELSPLFKE
jgi:CBS domain-containing protein